MASYVVITPAHNEEAFIEKTIQSMLSQTVRPTKWILVNDSSTDSTREIILQYLPKHSFMQLVDRKRPGGRDFGNKVSAFNQGLVLAKAYDFQFVGNLDADISLGDDYYERVIRHFSEDDDLGIAGGMVYSSVGDTFISQEVASDSVAGAVQLFRRACFEEIGGYRPLPQGGIDAAAEIMARMHGWKVRTFADITVLEHRRTGSANAAPLSAKVKEGLRSQSLGYGFVFICVRCVYRLMKPPRVIGSFATLYGYIKGVCYRNPIVLPPEVVHYLRHEQREKLLRLLPFLRWRQHSR